MGGKMDNKKKNFNNKNKFNNKPKPDDKKSMTSGGFQSMGK